MQRLRIAFIADTLQSPIGGGVIAGRHLVERLRASHQVQVVGADAEAEGDERLQGFGAPIKAMREMQFVMARPDREVLARVIQQADVVHLQFPFWLSFVALAEARKLGRPVVAAFHVQPENALLNIGIRSKRLVDALYRLWVDKLYNRADAVVCPSAFAAQKLAEHGLTRPALVVSNGVPPDISSGPRIREARHEGTFLILMVGRLAVEKHQEVLLAAVQRSAHREKIRLVIAGAGPRQAAIERMGRSMVHPPEVGFVPRERLVQLFRSADLFVHCSEVELEGIAVLEAMSVGLPVLVAEAAESAAGTFALDPGFTFPARDAGALAARIDALIEDPQRLEAAGASYRRIARSLSFDASVARLEALYLALVQGAATGLADDLQPLA